MNLFFAAVDAATERIFSSPGTLQRTGERVRGGERAWNSAHMARMSALAPHCRSRRTCKGVIRRLLHNGSAVQGAYHSNMALVGGKNKGSAAPFVLTVQFGRRGNKQLNHACLVFPSCPHQRCHFTDRALPKQAWTTQLTMKITQHPLEILLVEQGTRGNESLCSGNVAFICSFVKRGPIAIDRAWRSQENQGSNGKNAASERHQHERRCLQQTKPNTNCERLDCNERKIIQRSRLDTS